ncbi:MAG: hypothetical protein ACRDPG_05555, partial [Nocardioidaceae bacterium]
MAPEILRACLAAAIAIEPGQGIRATRLQLITKDVAICHPSSIANADLVRVGRHPLLARRGAAPVLIGRAALIVAASAARRRRGHRLARP